MVESTPVGLEASAAHQDDLVESSFRVADLNAIPFGEGATPGGLAKVGGHIGSITLNRHYVKDSAWPPARPRQDTDAGIRG